MMKKSLTAASLLLSLSLFSHSHAQSTYGIQAEAIHWQHAQNLQSLGWRLGALPSWSFYKKIAGPDASLYAAFHEAADALRTRQADGTSLAEAFVRAHRFHPLSQYMYYELGRYHFQEKDFARALQALEHIESDRLAQDARSDTQWMLGYAYFTQNQYNKAYDQLAPLKSYANPYRGAALYYCGYIRYQEGKNEEALRDLSAATEYKDFAPHAHYLIALTHYRKQQYREVVAYAGKVPMQEANPQFLLILGDSHYQLQQYGEAARAFEQYQRKQSIAQLPASMRYRIAYSYYASERYPQAIDIFRSLAGLQSQDKSEMQLAQEAMYYMGLAYLKQEQYQSALLAFEQARKATHQPEVARLAQFYYGKLCYRLNRRAEAIEVLNQYVLEYPNSPEAKEAKQLITRSYLFNNDYPKAITYLEQLPRLNAEEQKIYQEVAFTQAAQLFNSGNYREAVTYFEKAARYPVDASLTRRAYVGAGDAYSALGEYEKAIAAYQKALSAAPTGDITAMALYGLGYAHYNLQQYKEAQQHFERFLSLPNTSEKLQADALVRLGDCHYVLKNYYAGFESYAKALQKNYPDQDYIYYQQGIILDIQDKDADAQRSLQRIVQKGSNNLYYDKALFQLGQIALEGRQYQEAVNHFSTLMQQKPGSPLVPYALLRRAVAYTNLQKVNEAVEDYKRIIEQYPNHPATTGALTGAQELLTQHGRNEEFEALLAVYKKNNPNSDNLIALEFDAAKGMFFNEKYGKAIASFSLFLQEHPNSPYAYDARYYLAEAYFRTGDFEQAEKLHLQVIEEKKSTGYTRSLQRMGDYYMSRKEYAKAQRMWQELLQAAMNRRERSKALQGLMEAHYAMQSYDSTLHYCEEILKDELANTLAYSAAQLFKAKALIGKQQFEEAQQILKRMATENTDVFGAEAQYLIGELLYKQKQYQASLDALFALNERFPNQIKWRLRGYLLIADNYAALGDYFQARATLESIIQNTQDPEILAKAKQKLAQLPK
ncbi:tetratricopeptide repeat protein [Thermonema rossianum]|uniref:tetratricopeptide repeat protein n=1 Tax=Thermonema rossianum TaxID=55505 RepID=UPI000AF84B48|nr:tetratricopeptide repeat protein [Thermonema rossianum]